MAYDLMGHTSVRVVASGERRPLHAFANGSRRHPEPGALLIWADAHPFEHTGHVAVVTAVGEDHLCVAEQNFDTHPWPEGADYSRRLPARVGRDGSYWIRSGGPAGTILGWVIQTDDDPDNGDPVTFPSDNEFEVLEDADTEVVVTFSLLNP